MPKALIIDNHTKHLEQLRSLIPFESVVLNWNNINDTDVTAYSIVILSGGSDMPPVAEYPEKYIEERALIRSSSVPIIGICLGCELIAYEFGAHLKNLGKKRQGFVQVSFNPSFQSSFKQKEVIAYEAHSRIIENLPETFSVIAISEHGPEIIHHRERPLWGIQFHPEHLTERTLGDEIFLTILNESLSLDPNANLPLQNL
ncbi:MAG: gamma-glutamyl-gamma-aminobutyrate hydrolase family protein [bacterium]|nr:gamma-glutamyl-gamma-aminobutyrate hydrolase family protein [bacterium]